MRPILPRPTWSRRRAMIDGAVGALGLAAWPSAAARAEWQPPRSHDIASMTWIEVRDAIAGGWRTVIVPSGGLEQNGPQMEIGKHDRLVGWAAQRIATALGQTLVTPVLSFVPEGDYSPPTGHMRFPGTIGLPEPVFGAVLEGIARSLRSAGFTAICFIADHGGSVAPQAAAIARIAPEFAAAGVKVIDVSAYYGAAMETCWLHAQGERDADIGPHASIADTSELLAIHPEGVFLDRVPPDPAMLARLGGSGAPLHASVERGSALMRLKVDAAIRQIRAALGQA